MNNNDAVQLLDDFCEYLDEQIIRPAIDEIKAALDEINQHKPKSIADMLGEYLREAAVLLLIFVPVDLVIPRYLNKQPLPAIWLLGTLALSLAMLALGIWVERRN